MVTKMAMTFGKCVSSCTYSLFNKMVINTAKASGMITGDKTYKMYTAATNPTSTILALT